MQWLRWLNLISVDGGSIPGKSCSFLIVSLSECLSLSQNKEGILPVATLNVTQLTVLRQRCTFSKAEVYIDVYKGDDNFLTSGATLLSDLDLQETYGAIDSVATGRITSLFCVTVLHVF